MPLKTWDTKADFDSAYDVGLEPDGHPNTRPEVRGHYERSAVFNAGDPRLDFVTPEWSAILDHFAWPTTARILVVGCGYGWALEYLSLARGYAEAWGVDPSAYIQATKSEVSPQDGVQNALLGGRVLASDPSRDAGRDQCVCDSVGKGSTFDVIVTERVLSSLTDLEARVLSKALHSAALLSSTGTVVHVENDGPAGLAGFNEKTLADWKALLPADSFAASGGRHFVD